MNPHSVSRKVLAWCISTLTLLILLAPSLVPSGSTGPSPLAVTGVAPNPSGPTYIDRDTDWSGDLVAGGDIIIGSSARWVNVTWHDGSVRVSGRIVIGSEAQDFLPVRFVQERFITTFELSVAEAFVLEMIDPAKVGTSVGPTVVIRDGSTIESAITDRTLFPGGLVLKSGVLGRNLATIQIENTTFRNLGNYWRYWRGAIHSVISWTDDTAYQFAPGSFLRNLIFVNPSEYMVDRDPNANGVAVMLGNTSLTIEDSEFYGSYISTAFSKFVRDSTFYDSCRSIYDPPSWAVIENNVIYGKGCKTVDFFHRNGVFRNNTIFDAGAGAQSGAHYWKAIGNTFVRGGGPGGSTWYHEYRDNKVVDSGADFGIHEAGNYAVISGNSITNSTRSAIYVHPYLNGYTYQGVTLSGNAIDGFWSSNEAYPGVWIQRTANAVLAANTISGGYLALLMEDASNSTLESFVAYDVSVGIMLRRSPNTVIRNGSLSASVAGLALDGGNGVVKVVSVGFGDVRFSESQDTLQYSDYLDTFLPTSDPARMVIRDRLGAVAYDAVVEGGAARNVELRLYDQNQSSRSEYNPFAFQVQGLVPDREHFVFKNGVLAQTLNTSPSGELSFEERVDGRTSISIAESSATLDAVPPSAIRDLAVAPQSGGLRLSWTAPGDDADAGTAYRYDLRHSTTAPIDASNWGSAESWPQTWSPLPAGSSEVHAISLNLTATHWFALRASDELFNWGPVSNSPGVSPSSPLQVPVLTDTPDADYANVTLRWSTADTTRYPNLLFDVRVGSLPGWDDVLSATAAGLSVTLATQNGRTYYWSVRARLGSEASPWAPPDVFLDSGPVSPDLTQPQSTMNWAAVLVVALMLGGSVTALAFTLLRLRESRRPEAATAGDEVLYECPACGSAVQESDARCPGCSAEFEA